jgi:initiation factor 1A
MVKNTGGNKAKKFASKSFNPQMKATRFSIDKDEVYASVNKMLGGGMCEVLCIDGTLRLCVIRGKFSGKGKRDNRLCRGKWVLVGLRSWQITSKEKDKCDLLEVYNDNDKEKLIKNSKENFRNLLSITEDDNNNDDQIQFINEREEELFAENLNNNELSDQLTDPLSDNEIINTKNNDSKIESITQQMDWIDIDDI